MPSSPPLQAPLRIIVEHPLAGLTLALQSGKDGLEAPTAISPTHVAFDLVVWVGAPRAAGAPNFLGPHVQGPPASRFVYLCVGRRAGQAASPWDGRMKVPLTGITQAQVQANAWTMVDEDSASSP